MKVYVDSNDIGTTVTYKEENGKKEYINVYFLFAKCVIMCYNKLRKVIRSIKC